MNKKIIVFIFVMQILCLSSLSLKPGKKSDYTKSSKINRVFVDLEKEYKLANYFMNQNQKKVCSKLKGEEREYYVKSFWKSLDPNPLSEENEFLAHIEQRIEYANKNFSGARAGWESDKGRIYVKYGEPFEIYEGNTGKFDDLDNLDQQFFQNRDYELWKYHMEDGQDEIFLFFETQTFGELRLIYSATSSEVGFARWQKYLSEDNLRKIIGGFYE